jgi:CHAT domain-containing protein
MAPVGTHAHQVDATLSGFQVQASDFREAGDAEQRVSALCDMADALGALGRHGQGIRILQSELQMAGRYRPDQQAALQRCLGIAYFGSGNLDQAETYLSDSRKSAAEAGNTILMALVLNDLASIWALTGRAGAALGAFQESNSLARQLEDAELIISSGNNIVRVAGSRGDKHLTTRHLEESRQLVETLAEDSKAVPYLLETGQLLEGAAQKFGDLQSWRENAHLFMYRAAEIAGRVGDKRALSFANGYLGRFYENENNIRLAMEHTRKARFLADEIDDAQSRYLWEWQAGRLARAVGDEQAALQYYRLASQSLDKVKTQILLSVYDGFNTKIRPVYAGLADLLLSEAGAVQNTEKREALLREARGVIEKAKVAEIEEYFGDECLVVQENPTSVDEIGGTAVVYPIVFPDRTEIIASISGKMHWFTADVTEKRMIAEVRLLRQAIEIYDNNNAYLSPAQLLYDWLIRPIARELANAGINNIVFVPDTVLRTVPLTVLHDGQKFLVQRYAVITTPGLTLTSSYPMPAQRQILLAGITDSVQGFPALPSVEAEIRGIKREFPESTVLFNKQVMLDSLETQLSTGEFNIVHLATHGQFDSDHRNSFLIAYDTKLTMSQLSAILRARRYQQQPIDLLVMSACQTAAGDDRAALGLAGVALQSGARSALASLWFVSDAATSRLMHIFFAELKNPDISKAQAFQKAQLNLLATEDYDHPVFWSPFLLLGNWL